MIVNGAVAYLTDDDARDASRVTGIPWRWARVHQRGPLHPYLELSCLGWWDRWRIAWAVIGGYVVTGGQNGRGHSADSLGCCSAAGEAGT